MQESTDESNCSDYLKYKKHILLLVDTCLYLLNNFICK